MRGFSVLLVWAFGSSALAQGVPEPIKARVNELVAQCVQAGGSLGSMTGQGQFVIPRDFTGDGRTDFVVSEGNFPCNGKPQLFRADGLSRVELWVGTGSGGATLGFADRLMAYRVLDGRPARLQIARKGAACGTAPRCGDELRWSGTGFTEVATDGRNAAPRPATGAALATAAVPVAASPAVASGPAAQAGSVPPVQAGADARFKAQCRSKFLAEKPRDTSWIDPACADEWKRVTASQQVAETLLLAAPAGPGSTPPVAQLKARTPAVRWAARPEGTLLASGKLGIYDVSIDGKPSPQQFGVSWSKIAEPIPLDIPGAFAARGATVTLTSCEKTGTGEGERVWHVQFPGRPAFELSQYERTAPTGNAWSSLSVNVRVDGKPARRGPVRCDPFW